MVLALAVANGKGAPTDLKWWRGYSQLPVGELQRRLVAGEPCVGFDYHSGIDEEPAAVRERLYSFIHEAERLGQSVVFFEMDPLELDQASLDTPQDGWEMHRVPVAHVLNSLRSSEIIEYQGAHHDEAGEARYDPEGHADQLAEARARRWRGND